jgi:hypothetical protein
MSIVEGEPARTEAKQASMERMTVVNSIDALGEIHDTRIDLVVWERTVDPALETWLRNLPNDQLPSGRVVVSLRRLKSALHSICDASGTPDSEMRVLFARDVALLARTFAMVTSAKFIDVRLEAIGHDACWKFHRDFVPARLLTTYRGPGTQWAPPLHAQEALRTQRDFQGEIRQLRAHAVGIFKGASAGGSSGVVHRSPPMDGHETFRLLLCLNVGSHGPSDAACSSAKRGGPKNR